MQTARSPDFDGETYDRPLDHARLDGQLQRVRSIVSDGEWHTLEQIAAMAEAPHASVSARLRDLRKPKFGAHTIERKRIDDGATGLHVYRMVA